MVLWGTGRRVLGHIWWCSVILISVLRNYSRQAWEAYGVQRIK